MESALRGAVYGGISGSVGSALNGAGSFERIAGAATAGGVTSMIMGRPFSEGFKAGVLTMGLRIGMETLSGYAQTYEPASKGALYKGEPGETCIGAACDVVDASASNMGTRVKASDPTLVNTPVRPADASLMNEAGPLGYIARWLPGANSGSVFHDRLTGELTNLWSGFGSTVATMATIPPAFAAYYYSMGLNQYRRDFSSLNHESSN